MRVIQSIFGLLLVILASVASAMSNTEATLSDKKNKPLELKVETQVESRTVVQSHQVDEVAGRIEHPVAGREADEYALQIVAKIRRGILIPSGIPDAVRVELDLTMLPDGSVENLRLVKSSGYMAYDKAVMRAILKAQPLPLPQDAALFNRFRELKLVFRPGE